MDTWLRNGSASSRISLSSARPAGLSFVRYRRSMYFDPRTPLKKTTPFFIGYGSDMTLAGSSQGIEVLTRTKQSPADAAELIAPNFCKPNLLSLADMISSRTSPTESSESFSSLPFCSA